MYIIFCLLLITLITFFTNFPDFVHAKSILTEDIIFSERMRMIRYRILDAMKGNVISQYTPERQETIQDRNGVILKFPEEDLIQGEDLIHYTWIDYSIMDVNIDDISLTAQRNNRNRRFQADVRLDGTVSSLMVGQPFASRYDPDREIEMGILFGYSQAGITETLITQTPILHRFNIPSEDDLAEGILLIPYNNEIPNKISTDSYDGVLGMYAFAMKKTEEGTAWNAVNGILTLSFNHRDELLKNFEGRQQLDYNRDSLYLGATLGYGRIWDIKVGNVSLYPYMLTGVDAYFGGNLDHTINSRTGKKVDHPEECDYDPEYEEDPCYGEGTFLLNLTLNTGISVNYTPDLSSIIGRSLTSMGIDFFEGYIEWELKYSPLISEDYEVLYFITDEEWWTFVYKYPDISTQITTKAGIHFGLWDSIFELELGGYYVTTPKAYLQKNSDIHYLGLLFAVGLDLHRIWNPQNKDSTQSLTLNLSTKYQEGELVPGLYLNWKF